VAPPTEIAPLADLSSPPDVAAPPEETAPLDVASPADALAPEDVAAHEDTAAPELPPADIEPADAGAPPNAFIVHEWGTFTGAQGSNGAYLVGLHHEEEPLPDFVYGRASVALNSQKAIEGLPEPCNQKMETPVLYFHTQKAQDVTVEVEFPLGVISQWFPYAMSTTPPLDVFATNLGAGMQQKTLSGGSLSWTVLVDPTLDTKKAPPAPPGSVWSPARETSAAPVRFLGVSDNGQKIDETEHFLFYRGLGKFTLPVTVTSQPGGALAIANGAQETVAAAVILRAGADGKMGVAVLGALQAGKTLETTLPAATLAADTGVATAKAGLVAALVGAGLYSDEAQAMVDTWQKAWFATPGTRVLYLLPQSWTEGLLPLAVTPAPTQLVRVLVGRIELLTPEDEQAAVDTILAAKAVKGYGLVQSAFPHLLEPRLRRACELVGDVEADGWCAGAIAWAQEGTPWPWP